MITQTYDPDEVEVFFNKNYAPYMKTTSIQKLNRGLLMGFPDGSGSYWMKASILQNNNHFWVVWCLNYKDCMFNDANLTYNLIPYDCKKIFAFDAGGFVVNGVSILNNDRGAILQAAQTNAQNCSTLLFKDNWEIKDDYPW